MENQESVTYILDNLDISIIVPIYNVDKYLEQCLNSLIFEGLIYEIICVNDGSTDDSGAVLR